MKGVWTFVHRIDSVQAAKCMMVLRAVARTFEVLSAKITNRSNTVNVQIQGALSKVNVAGITPATTLTPLATSDNDVATCPIIGEADFATDPTYVGDHDAEGIGSVPGYDCSLLPEERVEVGPGAGIALRIVEGSVAQPFHAVAVVRIRVIA